MFYGLAVVDLNEYVPTEEYDIAICQSVLRHLSNPENILKKMVDSVKENGMIYTLLYNKNCLIEIFGGEI